MSYTASMFSARISKLFPDIKNGGVDGYLLFGYSPSDGEKAQPEYAIPICNAGELCTKSISMKNTATRIFDGLAESQTDIIISTGDAVAIKLPLIRENSILALSASIYLSKTPASFPMVLGVFLAYTVEWLETPNIMQIMNAVPEKTRHYLEKAICEYGDDARAYLKKIRDCVAEG